MAREGAKAGRLITKSDRPMRRLIPLLLPPQDLISIAIFWNVHPKAKAKAASFAKSPGVSPHTPSRPSLRRGDNEAVTVAAASARARPRPSRARGWPGGRCSRLPRRPFRPIQLFRRLRTSPKSHETRYDTGRAARRDQREITIMPCPRPRARAHGWSHVA